MTKNNSVITLFAQQSPDSIDSLLLFLLVLQAALPGPNPAPWFTVATPHPSPNTRKAKQALGERVCYYQLNIRVTITFHSRQRFPFSRRPIFIFPVLSQIPINPKPNRKSPYTKQEIPKRVELQGGSLYAFGAGEGTAGRPASMLS